jgi:transposase
MTTNEALNEVFSKSNKELAKLLDANYYTVTTWKYQHKRNGLSFEKQYEILTKLNYQLKNQISWNKQKEVQ